MILRKFMALAVLSLMASGLPQSLQAAGYQLTNLVANKQIYAPKIVDKNMVNAWGIAIRPAGAGGHFWISNTDTGTTSLYVGDTKEKPIYQDEIKLVEIALPKKPKADVKHAAPTGQVFNGSENEFIITQGEIAGPAKFIFCTEDGTISAWTEKKNADGTFQRPKASLLMVDNSKNGAIYKGLALSAAPSGSRLYAADFAHGQVAVFDAKFQPVTLEAGAFSVAAGLIPKRFAPFNIQEINGSLYVVYAKQSREAGEEQKGEGLGYVAEFDRDGHLKRVLEGRKLLNAPWGLALAPQDFGKYSGALLVGNFGDGRIVAFDKDSGKQLDILRTASGEPIEIDGLWALMFGNGVHLGQSNHLYFSAGPNDEKDGVFGKLQAVE